jgi:hypothetical protein
MYGASTTLTKCREAHILEWVHCEKAGHSPPPTPENTSSDNDGDVGWSDLEEEEEEDEEVPLASEARAKRLLLNPRHRRHGLVPHPPPQRA